MIRCTAILSHKQEGRFDLLAADIHRDRRAAHDEEEDPVGGVCVHVYGIFMYNG